MKEIFLEERKVFKILKYPVIGSILVSTCRLQVSLVYYVFNKFSSTGSDIVRETLSAEENFVLGLWSTYSLVIFMIGGCFIGLSFGNKVIRNIGILIYVLGILFILFAFFLNNGTITNGI